MKLMKMLSNKSTDEKVGRKSAASGGKLPVTSIGSFSEGSFTEMIEQPNRKAVDVTEITPPSTPDDASKKSVLSDGPDDVDKKWNPFSDIRGSVVTPPPKQTRDTDRFESLSELLEHLNNRGDAFMPAAAVKILCQQIVTFMAADEENPDLHMEGGRALFLLSLHDRTNREGRSYTRKGVRALIAAMEYFNDDALFQNQACVALESLVAWEENQTVILSKRGQVEVFYSAMESFPEDTELINACLGILFHLSGHSDAVEDDVSKDLSYAIPPILELLKENRDRVDFYESGLCTLAKLTEDNPSSQLLFCNDGHLGIRVAVDALHNRLFSDRYKIQLAAMLILQHVASHSYMICKGKIVDNVGLDRILDTLQQHCYILTRPSGKRSVSVPIMASGLQTLANLASSKLKEHDQTRQRMGKAVPVILEVLMKHSNIPQLQVTGFVALRNLADMHASMVTRNGGIAIIMKSMADHLKNSAVQKQICRTLVQLFSKRQSDANNTNNILSGKNNPFASESLDLVRAIAEEDGIEILFRTIRMHQAKRPVLEPALEALYYLSCSRDLTPHQKQQLCEEEKVVVLLGSIRSFIESETICEKGCGLVLNMSFFAPLRQDSMATVGGIEIVLSVMRRHGLNAKIQEQCSGILSGLCLDSATHDEFVKDEGISTVVSAMVVHPYAAGVQAFGCDILLSISSARPDQKESVVKANARSAASEALVRHKKHQGVQNRGSALLKALG